MRKLAAAVFALALLGGCVDRQAQQQAKRTESLIKDPTIPVKVAEVRARPVTEDLEITGSIVTGDDAQVGAKNAGRLVAVYVRDGDTVKAGQVIAQQETSDGSLRVRQQQALVDAARAQLQQAMNDARVGPSRSSAAVRASEARLKQAQVQLQKLKNGAREEERTQARWAVDAAKKTMETAKSALDRAQRLFDQGAISRSDLERAENAYMNALAGYNKALEDQSIVQNLTRPEDIAAAEQQVQAAIQQLESDKANQKLDVQYQERISAARANLRSAEEGLALARQAVSDAAIRSPFSGRVAGKPVQVGTFVAPGTPVVRIVGTGGVYFEGQVPEGRIRDVSPGKQVIVSIDALGKTTWTGKVSAVNPLGTEIGRLFNVRIQIDGDTGAIKPGMFARGVVTLRKVDNALVVPSVAILRSGGDSWVMVADGGKAKRVKVTPGLVNQNLTQVEGVTTGQTVIVEGQTKVVDGSTIKIEQPKEAGKADAS